MFKKLIKDFTKELYDESTDDMYDKLKDKTWGKKIDCTVKFNDGTRGVQYEDGTNHQGDDFILHELARQRNRDIMIKRVAIGIGAFYISGKLYTKLEKGLRK